MRYFVSLSALILFFTLSTQVVSAQGKAILGTATTTSEIIFPPLSLGPGFILPDSPFYFLDKIKQTIKIAIAVTPERKAVTRMQIAGERLAELRIMFARNNSEGIIIALNEYANELHATAKAINEAEARNPNLEALALDINNQLKLDQKVLDQIENQSAGELRLRIKTAQKTLDNTKNILFASLSEDEQRKDISDNIRRDLSRNIEEAILVTNDIEKNISQFEKEILGIQSGAQIVVSKDAVGQVLGTSTSPVETAREATTTLREAIEKTEQALRSLGVN